MTSVNDTFQGPFRSTPENKKALPEEGLSTAGSEERSVAGQAVARAEAVGAHDPLDHPGDLPVAEQPQVGAPGARIGLLGGHAEQAPVHRLEPLLGGDSPAGDLVAALPAVGDVDRLVDDGVVAAIADRVERAAGGRIRLPHQDALVEHPGEVTGPVAAPVAAPRPARVAMARPLLIVRADRGGSDHLA